MLDEAEPKLVYTAQSKRYFYCRDAVCEFVFTEGYVPVNPFRVFDYFLGDRVPRDAIRAANQRLLVACHEVWVFGTELADGVLVEIAQASRSGLPVRFFSIDPSPSQIREVTSADLCFESEVAQHVRLSQSAMLAALRHGHAERLVSDLGRERELTWAT